MSNQELITQNQTDNYLPVNDVNAIIFSPTRMQQIMEIATLMAKSKVTVPAHLRDNIGDCLAIAIQSAAWKMSPFAVSQKTHLVNGVMGYEAQLINAVIQSSGSINGRFHYEFKGEGQAVSCRVGAIINGETEITWGAWLSAASVTIKNSPLWKTNVQQQLSYLQIKNWSRLYCPGAILGVYSADELMDAEPFEKEINPLPPVNTKTTEILDKLAAKKQHVEAVVTLKETQVDTKTGEIIDNDKYGDLKIQIAECKNKGQLAKIYNALSEEDKAATKDIVKTRQDELNAIVSALKEATKAKEPEPEQAGQDWASAIRNCKSADQLTSLLNDADPAIEMEYASIIDEVFDSFRAQD